MASQSEIKTLASETEGAMVTTLCGQVWACPSSPTTGNPKIVVTCKVIIDDVSAVTLKRTDTTLDLSQMAKRFGFQKLVV